MSFDDDMRTETSRLFADAGEAAQYLPQGGGPIDTYVMVDRDVRPFPSGFESQYAEPRTEIDLLAADVSTPARGDQIQVGAALWTVQDPLDRSPDGAVIRVSVR